MEMGHVTGHRRRQDSPSALLQISWSFYGQAVTFASYDRNVQFFLLDEGGGGFSGGGGSAISTSFMQ